MSTSVPGNSCNPCFSGAPIGCSIRLADLCVYYSGPNIPAPNIKTGDNLEVVITKLATYGIGTGTVTSVSLTMPAGFTVGGSPITNSGTFAVTMSGTTTQYLSGNGTLQTVPIQTASNGLTLSANTVILGQNVGQLGNPALLSSNREVPLNGKYISFIDTGGQGYIKANAFAVVGETFYTDGTNTGISFYGRNANVGAFNFAEGINEYSFVTANTNFFGYIGVQSWAYVTGAQGDTAPHGKFTNYISAFSAGQVWDGSLTGGGHQLANHLSYFSAINTQTGGVLKAYDVYASEINSVGVTNLNPPVTNHYAFFAEPFTYATNNYGVYINGVQKNYFGGNVGIGQNNPVALLHVAAGTTTLPAIQMTAGALLTTPVNGVLEFDGTHLYFTIAGVRQTII